MTVHFYQTVQCEYFKKLSTEIFSNLSIAIVATWQISTVNTNPNKFEIDKLKILLMKATKDNTDGCNGYDIMLSMFKYRTSFERL